MDLISQVPGWMWFAAIAFGIIVYLDLKKKADVLRAIPLTSNEVLQRIMIKEQSNLATIPPPPRTTTSKGGHVFIILLSMLCVFLLIYAVLFAEGEEKIAWIIMVICLGLPITMLSRSDLRKRNLEKNGLATVGVVIKKTTTGSADFGDGFKFHYDFIDGHQVRRDSDETSQNLKYANICEGNAVLIVFNDKHSQIMKQKE